MGYSAATIVVAGLSASESRRQRKSAEREAQKQRDEAEKASALASKERAEEEARMAASHPTASMSTTSRIAAEKFVEQRRSGKGRKSTQLDLG